MTGYDIQTYYLGFEKGNHWTARFCKKDFSHVQVWFKEDASWVILNPNVHKLEYFRYAKLNREKMNRRMTIVELTTRISRKSSINMVPFYGLSCVPIVKYITGIHCHSITPWQLFKKLSKMHYKGRYTNNVVSIKTISRKKL